MPEQSPPTPDPASAQAIVQQVVAEVSARNAKPVSVPSSVVVEGPVTQGVEAGSVVLTTAAGQRYQLGGSWSHLIGHTVRVEGQVQADRATTTQQGVPLLVVRAG